MSFIGRIFVGAFNPRTSVKRLQERFTLMANEHAALDVDIVTAMQDRQTVIATIGGEIRELATLREAM